MIREARFGRCFPFFYSERKVMQPCSHADTSFHRIIKKVNIVYFALLIFLYYSKKSMAA